MAYKYTAYTMDKKIVSGRINAASENIAEEELYRAGYHRILSLKEVRSGGINLEKALPSLFGAKAQDVIDFSKQLATLIESGIAVLTALQLLRGQVSRDAFRKVISGLLEDLQGGASFSQALSRYPEVFPTTFCQVVGASEHTGSLEVGLRQVAGYMEKRLAIKKKISRAMVYPVLVSLVAVGVFALLVTVALPPLVGLFTSLGAELPWTTRLLITAADFLINYKLHLLVVTLIAAILIAGYMRLPSGRKRVDRLMLQLPVIGPINLERHMSQVCQTMSMMLRAGLQLPQTIDIVGQTLGNGTVRAALREVREKLMQGQGLSRSMAANELFPRLVVEMVSVGEKTGTLESSLATVAEHYEHRVEQRIDTLISMIEPFLTVAIGLVVLFIALSMITPLYSILSGVK